jgi:surface antigen
VNPAALLMPRHRFRKELIVIGVVLTCLLGLPLIAVVSLTDVPALAKNDSLTLYTGTDKNQNLYDYGYCTWWASKRRSEVSAPIPQHWGDAHSWALNALLAGYRVDHSPAPYSIMQTEAGALGHVAFVESVTPDGGWTVSEMNVAGWDILSSRTFKPGQAKDYSFIH